MKSMRGKISVLFFALIFALCLSVPTAMADPSADATAIAGASAGATAIGTNSQATGGSANVGVNLGVGLTNNSPSSASAGVSDVSATTGGSSAELHLTQTSTSTGSKIPPNFANPPQGVSAPVVQNFGPVGKVVNVMSGPEIRMMFELSPDWNLSQAKALIKSKPTEAKSRAILRLPALTAKEKVKVINLLGIPEEKVPAVIKEMGLIQVGTVSNKADHDGDSSDVLGQSIVDTAKMGADILLLTAADGEIEVHATGWGIGGGGSKSSVSGADFGLASVIYAGTGWGNGSSKYRGYPFARGFACRTELPSEPKPTIQVVPSSEEPAKNGIWFDDSGMPRFPWEKAHGAGILNGN